MQQYLISKATKAGFKAWPEREQVAIKLPISFFGKDSSFVIVKVSNIAEYRAIMGDD